MRSREGIRFCRFGAVFTAALLAVLGAATAPGFSAPVRGTALTVSVTSLSPLVALIAGILILVIPRLLNFIVALYLILIGLLGLFAR